MTFMKLSEYQIKVYDNYDVKRQEKNNSVVKRIYHSYQAGVARKIKNIYPTCLYTHCYGHALNLAVKDACDKVAHLKSTFETAKEAIKIDKDSPKSEHYPQLDGRCGEKHSNR